MKKSLLLVTKLCTNKALIASIAMLGFVFKSSVALAQCTNFPTITSKKDGVTCMNGPVSIEATASAGATVSWYANATGGSALATGTTYNTVYLTSSVTYYAEARILTDDGVCISKSRTAVLAEINTVVPTLTTLPVAPPIRCDTGSITMTAAASVGVVEWYNNGGSQLLGTGNTFESPAIFENTYFYVAAVYKGCKSVWANPQATVVIPPVITGTTPSSMCEGQSLVQISATSTGGGSKIWYADSTSTTILFSSSQGIYNITPGPAVSTKYYVQASRSGCDNGIRVPVLVTVKPKPVITSTTPASNCGTGSVTLNATATPGSSVRWFLSSTDIIPAFTGNTFTTPTLGSNKTYYLLPSDLNGCAGSTTRVTVLATINTLPNTSVTVNGNTLTATQTNASYQWINCDRSANIKNETNISYTPTESGNYKVEITDSNSCKASSLCQNLIVTSLEEVSGEHSLNIYPNPSKEEFRIENPNLGSIEIFNSTGQSVLKILESKEIEVISGMPEGVYVVKILQEGVYNTKKIIVSK